MKRILLSLVIVAPVCAMQPDKKAEIVKNIQRISAGIAVYNAMKPIAMGCIVATQPSLLSYVAIPDVVYGTTELATYMHLKQHNNQK